MKRLAVLFLVALLLLPGLAQAKIFLEDTNDTLRVVTASGVTTIHMYASWADITTTAITPGSSTARVTTATTTALVASPAASTQRQIKGLSVYNAHASSSNAITVEFFDGTNATTLVKYTLLAGETLQWGEDDNFNVIDASGQIKGLVAATQSGTWTVQPGNTANTTPWLATINQGGNSAVVTTTTPGASDAGVVVRNINSSAAADNSTNSTAKSPVLPCTANASAPSWTEGRQVPCSTDLSGNERVNVANINGVAPSMGAGNTGTGVQRVIEATDSQLSAGVGATGDAAATAGSTGSMNAKQRLMTSQLDSIKTAVELIDNMISGSGANISQYNGATAQIATNSLNTTGAGLPAAAIVGQCDDTTPTALTENQFGHARINCTTHQQLIEVGTALPTGTNSIGQVTANAGTNLNTSALLTTSAHDAAFGTAGSADAQVRTVQGIASMTPLQVQSNSANLATEASVDGLEGGLGAAADAAATAGSTGSVTAKLRLMTSQLDTISTNLSSLLTSSQLVDDDQTGASVHYRTSAGSTEDEHEVKGSAGRLFSITATNTNAAVRYLRCANQVIGSTTPGTTTVFLGLAIPGATTGAGFTTNFGPSGIAFSTGLTCWLVTGAADTDVAEVAANEIKVIYSYK